VSFVRIAKHAARAASAALALALSARPAAGQDGGGGGGNFNFGPVEMDLRANAGLEWNSNVGKSENDPESDVIARLGLNFGGQWDATEENQLRINLGLTYEKFFNHPELDSTARNNFLTVSPDTEFSFNVRAGNFSFTVFDEIDLENNIGTLRFFDAGGGGIGTRLIALNEIDNTFGIDGVWSVNPFWSVTGGLSRNDVVPLDDGFDFRRRVTHRLSAGVSHQFAANLRFGLNGSVSDTHYPTGFQNDSQSFSLNFVTNWEPSAFWETELSLGWYRGRFGEGGINPDASDSSGFDARLKVTHFARRDFQHSIVVGRNFELGTVSNSTLNETVEYEMTFSGFERSSIRGTVAWLTSEDSGGFAPEDLSRVRYSLGFGYDLSEKLDFEAYYRLTQADSNIDDRSYDQHALGVRFTYDF